MSRTSQRAGIYVAFVPWILFGVMARHDTVEAAAIVALLAAIAISIPSLAAGRPKLLEIGAVAAFAGFTIVAIAVDPAASDWLARYAQAIADGLLALLAVGSLLMGTPFTEQYARESVPQQLWSSPIFKRVNRELTLMWAIVFAAMLPSHLITGALDTPSGNMIFGWMIPIALVVWAVKRTERLSSAAGEHGPAGPSADPARA